MRPVPLVAAQDEKAQERRADKPCRIIRRGAKTVAQAVELAHVEIGKYALFGRRERFQSLERRPRH
jgi:hypothetical protein